jgi:muramoyltetrapeptide carboxypeptidase LdcA involved in peptidoglycan recycling
MAIVAKEIIMNGITKETFDSADKETQLRILFDYQHGTHENINKILELLKAHPGNCDDRFKKLENMKMKNTALSAIMGLIGGFSAMVAKLKLWG